MLVTISGSWQTSVLIYLLLSFYYKDTESSDYRLRYWKANTNRVEIDLTRKEVPELGGSALVFRVSAIDKKSVYWSSSWARILNVFDVYYFHHHRRCWPHSLNTCLRCTWYRGCRPTHQIPVQCWASIATHCWFDAVQSSTTLTHH